MAKDIESKKRKASLPNGDAKMGKTKEQKITSETTELAIKKRKTVEDAVPAEAKKSKLHKSDASIKTLGKPTETTENVADSSKDVPVISKKINKKSEKADKLTDDVELNDDEVTDSDSSESEIDDQTEALLQGFDSDRDEEDAANEGGLKPGQRVPVVPTMTNRNKKILKRLEAKKQEETEGEKPGVVYIGRIPHGFYENEMRAYFMQFGNIQKLRLSRNRKTGQSKHYAFIQFESATVADIVAKTMDNYLLFGHILKVRVVPDEQLPADIFKGANKRFKKVPWNKIEGRKLALGASEEVWDKRIGREEQRRKDKAAKLQEIGYDFESIMPLIKPAKGVAKKGTGKGVGGDSGSLRLKKKKPKVAKIFGIDVAEGARLLKEKEQREKAERDARQVAKQVVETAGEDATLPAVEVKDEDSKKRKADAEVTESTTEKTKKQKKDKKGKKDKVAS